MFYGKGLFTLLAALSLVACAETQQTNISTLDRQSTSALCTTQSSATGLQLLTVEAELGARGVLQCETSYGSTSYVGARTAATVGRKLYARTETIDAARDLKNCSDFASAGQAQRYFLSQGGPISDPSRLDADGDGNACEWGKTLEMSVSKYKPKPARYVAPRSYSRTCHTGPRGGRYYYSASGGKVYGC